MKTDRDLLKGSVDYQYESFDLNNGSLNPISFMGLRGNHYKKDFFFAHPIYDKIKTKIIEDDLIFIVGNPLAGKTRIVYDTLSNLQKGYIVKPKIDKSIKEYLLPRRKDLIVFLDEIDDYCRTNAEAVNKVLFYLIKNKIKCIATCRTGPEFNQLKKALNAHIFSELHSAQILIPRFDKNESSVKSFLISNASRIKNIESFDGNMGALILPLDDMRKRYTSLVEQDKQLPIAILKGLKLHYHLLNYESKKSFYDDSKILNFCVKYLQEDITKHEWENAKGELTTDETTLNFIDEKEFIIIEEAYLDFLYNENGNSADVVDSTLNKYKIDRLLNDIYKDIIAKKTWGFPTTIFDYNKAIEKTETYEEAIKIFNDIPKYLKPDAYTYTFLIKRTKDIIILKKLYSEMKRNRIKIEHTARNEFAGQFDSFEDLINAFIELDKEIIAARNGTSDRLIKLAKINPKETLDILFKKFSIEQVYSNPVFNEICRQCCNDNDDFINYVEPFIEKLGSLEFPLMLNYIKMCSKINKPLGLILLDKFCDKSTYDYLNEKGNCLREISPYEALGFYIEAEKKSRNEIERIIAKCNYCNLVYEKELIDKIDEAIALSSIVVNQKLNIFPAKYLRQAFLLLEIWKTPIANLTETIDALLKRADISKHTFRLIISKIKETDKQKVVKNIFFPLLLQTDDQQVNSGQTLQP